MNFRTKLYQFMQGRNGVDAYGRFLNRVSFGFLLAAIVCSFLAMVFASHELLTAALVFRILYFVLYAIGFALLIWCSIRILSRRVAARQKENTRFLYRRQKIVRFFESKKQEWKNRKKYKYFKCPKCGQRMRAPRHKGKIRVTCNQCTNVFLTKT